MIERLVVGIVLHEELLCGFESGSSLATTSLEQGKMHAFGGLARGLDVLDIGEAVALEELRLHLELGHVLRDDGLGGLDRPVHDGLDPGGVDLGEEGGEIGRVGVIDLGDRDRYPVLRGVFRAGPCRRCRSRCSWR